MSAAFEEAFRPATLTDDRIDKLAQLVGGIRYLSLTGSCWMTDNDETLLVSEHYCAHCNAIHGNDRDGEADCEHKQAMRRAIEIDIAYREAQAQEYAEEQAYARAVLQGVG